jgi:hypothetical protein
LTKPHHYETKYVEYVPVTVDKSHLITIGEKLYSESIELIRELVNDAYDTDAAEVDIRITHKKIEVSDNASGMEPGLFNAEQTSSERLRRCRPGELGLCCREAIREKP